LGGDPVPKGEPNPLSRSLIYAIISSSAFLAAAPQTPPPAILTIDIQNLVEYQADISDPSKFAGNPGVTPAVQPKNFFVVTLIGDIVAVNGQPAAGTYVGRTRPIVASPAPAAEAQLQTSREPPCESISSRS
jgi:hypothetical protein